MMKPVPVHEQSNANDSDSNLNSSDIEGMISTERSAYISLNGGSFTRFGVAFQRTTSNSPALS